MALWNARSSIISVFERGFNIIVLKTLSNAILAIAIVTRGCDQGTLAAGLVMTSQIDGYRNDKRIQIEE